MARYSKFHSNYILSKKHQTTHKGSIFERDWVTIGGQHQIEKGKRPYYNDSNFLFTDNSYPSYKKKFNFGKWIAHWVYDDVKDAKEDVNIVKVNDSSNDIRDFAYYGSAVELVRSSVTNIINEFPATVTISSEEITTPDGDGGYETMSGWYTLNNPFNVDFVHTLSEEEKNKYNVERFLRESFDKYTINGEDIESYNVTSRILVGKTVSGNRTVKHLEKGISLLPYKTINQTKTPKSYVYNGLELVDENKLKITNAENTIYDENITQEVNIAKYNYLNGYLETESGERIGRSFYPDNNTVTTFELTTNGYGLKEGNLIKKTVTGDYEQYLKTISLASGQIYTFKVEGQDGQKNLDLTEETGTISIDIFYHSNYNEPQYGRRRIVFRYLNSNFSIPVDDVLSLISFDDYETNGDITLEILNSEDVVVQTTQLSNINVNLSQDFGVYNGTYKFIISSTNSNAKYIGSETTISNKHVYYHRASNTVTFEGGFIPNIPLSSETITQGNFTFSLAKKNTISENSTVIISVWSAFTLVSGNYFIDINGIRTGWVNVCHKDSDRHTHLNDSNKIGIKDGKITLINTDGNEQIIDITLTPSNNPYNISFYLATETLYPCTFIQFLEEGDIPSDCERLDCKPKNWLPNTTVTNGWDKYVKDCPDCVSDGCLVTILASQDIEGSNENLPICDIKINDYEIRVYIKDGEEIYISDVENLVIKPKKELLDTYFSELEGFEKQLLNLNSKPFYSNSFLTPIEGELTYKYVYRDYTWPSVYDSDLGYAIIDIMSETYMDYLTKLIDLATVFDELWCDNIYKNMTHESIKNFDWTYTKDNNDGDEQDNVDGGNQVIQLLRVYGRFFDDVKRKIDGIGFVKNNTYEGFDNQPDAEISDRIELKGWDIISTIPNFRDSEQGYINKFTGVIITKEEHDNLPDDTNTNNSEQVTTDETGTQSDYELVFYNEERLEFIGETAYNTLEDEEKELYVKYYPYLNLGDVTIDDEFLSTYVNGVSTNESDSSNDPNEGKWYPSANSSRLTCSKVDIEFMRKLMLSSSRIFNTKGTRQAIEMVMAMFGIGENDYTLTEGYYSTVAKPYDSKLSEDDNEDDTKLIDAIENVNYFKDYPKNYDDIYSGVPLKDIFLDSNHVVVPYYDHSRIYDGDFVFESRGGWGKKTDTLVNGEGNESGQYTETMSYLHVVSDFSDLLDLNPNSLSDGDIYYVTNISTYSEYVAELPDNMSHFFHLKEEIVVEGTDEVTQENGKYNPQLPESWENVDMTNDDEVSKKAKYLDSIISVNVGNNPHVGFGTYDDGNEFKEYMETPFKYSIDHYLLPDIYKEQAEKITFELTDEYSEDVYININNGSIITEDVYNDLPDTDKADYVPYFKDDKTKVLIDYSDENGINEVNDSDEEQTKTIITYYLNHKYFKITNHIENELFKQYFNDVILKYIMQVVPSTTLLVLDRYVLYGNIESYGDITVNLSYNSDLNWNGSNSISPILNCRQSVVYENGVKGSIGIKPETIRYVYVGNNAELVDDSTGVITGNGTEADFEDRQPIGTVTVTVGGTTADGNSYEKTGKSEIYQRGRKVIGYSDMKIEFSYIVTDVENSDNKLEWKNGKAQPLIHCHQTTYYDNGDSETISWGNENESLPEGYKTLPEGYKALNDDFNISFTGTYNRLDSDETGIMEVDEAHKDDEYNNSYSDRNFEIVTVTLTRKEEDSSNTDNNP